MNDEDLILKDWEMTKDRIKHFDDVVIRIRLNGIPIGTAIQAAGLASLKYTHTFKFGGIISPTSLIIAIGSIYLVPIFLLDMLHYDLLMKSVKHGMNIEDQPKYKGKLQITTKLTSDTLTKLHYYCAILVYAGSILGGLLVAFIINTLPIVTEQI